MIAISALAVTFNRVGGSVFARRTGAMLIRDALERYR